MPFGFLLIDHEQSLFGLVRRATTIKTSERKMAVQKLDVKEERNRRDYSQSQGI